VETEDRRVPRPSARVAGGIPSGLGGQLADVDVEALSDSIVDSAMSVAFAEQWEDRELEEALRTSVRDDVAGLRNYLLGLVSLEQAVPARAVALAAVQARLDIPLPAIHRAYRISARQFVHGSLERAEDLPAGEDPGEVIDALDAVIAAFFDYQDRVLEEVSAAHASEEQALRASKAQLRRQVLHAYLREEASTTDAELAEALQYPVEDVHLAIVLSGGDEEERHAEVAARLRAAAAATDSLVHVLGLGRSAVWITRAGGWGDGPLAAIRAALEEVGMTASIGSPRAGGEGLRLGLRESESVERVRLAWGAAAPAVIDYGQVKHEVLALADPDSSRHLVEDELRGLAVDGEPAAQLRETLMAWFAAGSHVSAAAALGIHEHTVRNRLRRAEELVGHPLTTRRTELQVALRLHRVVAAGTGA
jgi:DNA-binding PucR family transcriptional regulator